MNQDDFDTVMGKDILSRTMACRHTFKPSQRTPDRIVCENCGLETTFAALEAARRRFL